MQDNLFLVALGCNQRRPGFGSPRSVLLEAALQIDWEIGAVRAFSKIIETAPIGPSLRRYANAALVLETDLDPGELLAALLALEADFGRRRMGQRWRARVLDLDIILWSGGIAAQPGLQIPHPAFRTRSFVLGPAAQIAPGWRDPVSGLSLAHLHARLTRPRPLPR